MTSPIEPGDPPPDVSLPGAAPAKKGFISPTSSFVDFVVLESEYFTEEGRANAHLYFPHSHRVLKRPTTDFETCVHLLKGSVGAGLLAMPKAFQNSGIIIGIIGTIFLGATCIYSMSVLIRMQYIQCQRLRVPFLVLPRSMKIALKNGPPCLHKLAWIAPILVDFFLVAYQLGICTAYILFVAESIKHVVKALLDKDIDIRLYVLMVFIPFVLINYIRDLKKLTPLSLTANVLIMLSLGCCFYYIFAVGPFKVEETNLVSSVTTWPLFMGTVLFALEAVGVIIALEHNMKNRQKFLGRKGIFPWSLSVVVVLYIFVGLVTYLKYGENVQETLIASLPSGEWLSLSVEGVYAFCIFLSYPLQCYVSLEILWGNYLVKHIEDQRKECCVEYILRTVVVIITLVGAVLVPKIDIMISLVGAFCLSTLGMIFPFLLELCTLWPDDLGRWHYVVVKDIFFIIFGFFILTVGTYVSLYSVFSD